MMFELDFTLLSDATFGNGNSVAGLIDTDVEHDPRTGLPFLRGRALRGLLVEECANLLYGLERASAPQFSAAKAAAARLFGVPGSNLKDAGVLFVGRAELPAELQQAVRREVVNNKVTPDEVLEALTTLRCQTAIQPDGAPEKNSLRTQRAVLRETTFTARLTVEGEASELESALLAACAQNLRRAGAGRNRGRGRLVATLRQNDRALSSDALFTEENL